MLRAPSKGRGRHAGQREQVHRAEHVQNGLDRQDRHGGAGSNGIEAAAADLGRADGKHRKDHDDRNGA